MGIVHARTQLVPNSLVFPEVEEMLRSCQYFSCEVGHIMFLRRKNKEGRENQYILKFAFLAIYISIPTINIIVLVSTTLKHSELT